MAASFSSPFEPLQLSRQASGQLEELARVLIAQVAVEFEEHMEDATRSVDASRWKLVKEREDVHVYKERPPDRRQRRARRDTAMSQRFSTDSMDAGSAYGGDLDSEPPVGDASDLPILLTVGTIQGDLYDTMYGVTNPTTEMMRIKTAYIQDGMIDSAVLARLREPTPVDPFRSLTVKWCIKGQALHLRTLVSNRDLVYLEATGLMRLPRSGELIGYQLLHSVDFPQTHRIQGCMRGNMSIVGLYRQHREGVVEMFGKGFVDPTGRIVRALVVKSATEAMLSTWRTIQTAQLKKLAYALRTRHLDRHGVIRRRRKSSSFAAVDSKSCSICSKTLSSMAALSFGKKGFASRCQLCLDVVCTSCRVKKQLASVAPDGWLDVQQVPFCVACIDAVTKTSAFDIALDELVRKDARARHGGVSLSSTLSSFDTRSESEWSETARKASYA